MRNTSETAAAMAEALNLLGEASTEEGIARLRGLKGDVALQHALLEALDECLTTLARALPVSNLDTRMASEHFMAAKLMLPAVALERADQAGALAASIRTGLEVLGIIPRAPT